jgi:hypothetical protein
MDIRRKVKTVVFTQLLVCLFVVLSSASAPASDDWIYSVAPGENLWVLADRYLKSVSYTERLRSYNKIADPYTIAPGTKIKFPVKWLKTSPFFGRVIDLHGQAWITEADSDQRQSLTTDTWLMEGDSVETLEDSNVRILFIDGSQILLQENSKLTLEQVGIFSNSGMIDNRLILEKGRLETLVAPAAGPANRFEIKTPVATTSVRGTDYRVNQEADRPITRTEVLGGKIEVKSKGGAQLLKSKQGLLIRGAEPPIPPVALLPPPEVSELPRVIEQVPVQIRMPEVAESTGFRVQVSSREDFGSLIVDEAFSGNLFKGPDLPDGNYFFRIRAIDANGLEGLNAMTRIELNARPEPPLLLEPKPADGVVEARARFVWSTPIGINQFHFQLATDPDFRELAIDNAQVKQGHYVSNIDLVLGNYYWRVAAIDEKEGAGPFSDAQYFRRVAPAPALEEPEISEEHLQIRWRAGLPGQQYQFQLAKEPSFSAPLIDQIVDEPGITLDKPDGGTYYMRIRTIEADGLKNPFGITQTLDVPRKQPWWMLLLLLFVFAI